MRERSPYMSVLPNGLLVLLGFILNTLAAVFGAGLFEFAIGLPIPAHSISQIILREVLLSISVGATTGFFVYRAWESTTAKWVWILPAILFGVRALGIMAMAPTYSVMSDHVRLAKLWNHLAELCNQMSGAGCAGGFAKLGCRNFFFFTNTLFRTVSYAAGAVLCERYLRKTGVPSLRS